MDAVDLVWILNYDWQMQRVCFDVWLSKGQKQVFPIRYDNILPWEDVSLTTPEIWKNFWSHAPTQRCSELHQQRLGWYLRKNKTNQAVCGFHFMCYIFANLAVHTNSVYCEVEVDYQRRQNPPEEERSNIGWSHCPPMWVAKIDSHSMIFGTFRFSCALDSQQVNSKDNIKLFYIQKPGQNGYSSVRIQVILEVILWSIA